MAAKHYCIPPLDRINLTKVLKLIECERYFVLHAPRQTGKTSMLLALADRLNTSGKYRCFYVNFEPGQAAEEDTARALRAVLGQLGTRARITQGDEFVASITQEVLEKFSPDGALMEVLVRWAEVDPKPLVLMIDEIDTLVGRTLISVLRQLRAGYDLRPTSFPHSVILCGLRDVRDYRICSAEHCNYTSGGSAFNIKAESLRLGDFSEWEMRALLAQHTAETGQAFEPRAVDRVWNLTLGQPWLVNALAHQACFKERAGWDRSRPISEAAVDGAKETLILKRVIHLDQLAAKLEEDRVRRVIEPMLIGGERRHSRTDLKYVRDLGLVARKGPVRIANPIYAEVIPRELTAELQEEIEPEAAPFLDAHGRLRMTRLLERFQEFFRANSEHWIGFIDYKEAGAQLLLQAFLQGVINGGGRINSEFALGRRRTDLLVQWPQGGRWIPGEVSKYVIECKAVRPGRGLETTIGEGVRQTASYMDLCGAEAGHLLIFDQRPDRAWEARIFRREERKGRTSITVWGM